MIVTRRKATRFLILTNGRSGSNFLVNTLNLHPEIVNYGEMLGRWNLLHRLYKVIFRPAGWTWFRFLAWLLDSKVAHYGGQMVSALSSLRRGKTRPLKRYGAIKAVGIKDFVFLMQRENLWPEIVAADDIVVVSLERSDALARAISLQKMSESGVVRSDKAAGPTSDKVRIDPDRLVRDIGAMAKEADCHTRMLAELPPPRLLRIDYHEYFGSREGMVAANRKMFAALGVRDAETISEQRKLGSRNVADDIANMDEVVTALDRHGLGTMANRLRGEAHG